MFSVFSVFICLLAFFICCFKYCIYKYTTCHNLSLLFYQLKWSIKIWTPFISHYPVVKYNFRKLKGEGKIAFILIFAYCVLSSCCSKVLSFVSFIFREFPLAFLLRWFGLVFLYLWMYWFFFSSFLKNMFTKDRTWG